MKTDLTGNKLKIVKKPAANQPHAAAVVDRWYRQADTLTDGQTDGH